MSNTHPMRNIAQSTAANAAPNQSLNLIRVGARETEAVMGLSCRIQFNNFTAESFVH